MNTERVAGPAVSTAPSFLGPAPSAALPGQINVKNGTETVTKELKTQLCLVTGLKLLMPTVLAGN